MWIKPPYFSSWAEHLSVCSILLSWQPLTKKALHSISWWRGAHIDRGLYQPWPKVLHETPQLREATVLTVWNPCNGVMQNKQSHKYIVLRLTVEATGSRHIKTYYKPGLHCPGASQNIELPNSNYYYIVQEPHGGWNQGNKKESGKKTTPLLQEISTWAVTSTWPQFKTSSGQRTDKDRVQLERKDILQLEIHAYRRESCLPESWAECLAWKNRFHALTSCSSASNRLAETQGCDCDCRRVPEDELSYPEHSIWHSRAQLIEFTTANISLSSPMLWNSAWSTSTSDPRWNFIKNRMHSDIASIIIILIFIIKLTLKHHDK